MIHKLDRSAFIWVAEHHVPWANRALPALSRSANHSKVWGVAAAGLALGGGRPGRRAAMRGLGAVALASTVTNTVLKSWIRRPRPVLDPVPHVRRLSKQPWTTSFPSGHAASAAAFATGVALESPRLGVAVGAVAGGVAFSRVYTGVHYPGDVLAGAALGAGMAAVTLRWWPRRPDEAAHAVQPRQAVPQLAGGEGLVVVTNPSSGPTVPGAAEESVAERIRALLPRATVIERGVDEDLMEALEKAAEDAVVLGVAGGDGSVNCGARVALDRGLPFAAFPAGTLNHFAGDLGLYRLEDTAQALTAGDAVLVDVAELARDRAHAFAAPDDGEPEIFLNTFSLGVYPEMVRVREKLEGRVGKWPAMVVALARVLRDGRPVKMRVNGRPRSVWLLFLGNGEYAPAGFTPTYRPNLADGLLDVRMVDGARKFARTRLVAAVLTGTLGTSRVYDAGTAPSVTLTEIQEGAELAVDGEVRPGASQLRVAKRRRLVVYRPEDAQRV
jgi:undecaprenyl-diphosphatase